MPTTAHTRDELVRTWQRFKNAHQQRLLRDVWPRVVPLPGGGPDTPAEVTRLHQGPTSTQAWIKALAAFDEIRSYRDFDTLLRRSVELLREALGLERAAIFLVQKNRNRLGGCFGTGLLGETTDERDIAFDMGQSHREAFALSSQGLAQWSRFPDVPLFAQNKHQTVVLRTGENVIVPIPANNGCIGLIACDNGFSGTGLDTETLIRTAVFARVLSPALTPWLPCSDGNAAELPSTQATELVGATIRRLRLDPNEPRESLAKAVGTTADRLGRVFKAEMGETLPEYRNKLRLERFFSVVDPGGGNLLAAAFDAGFGSYAQFNRVFHHRYGTAPVVYLKRGGLTSEPT